MPKKEIAGQVEIEDRIFLMRGRRVMLDADLAVLYGVKTKYLNQQVNRNSGRFPGAFMFRLTLRERDELVANCNRLSGLKHSSTMPRAFTEHGVAMLASVLRSAIAVKISVSIIETFIRLKEMFSAHKELAEKLRALEQRIASHDAEIGTLFDAIRSLMPKEDDATSHQIGFRP
ncbi:MAG TPA: hypothetical protein DCW72_02715 [Elusimicrobia bacterium]|nr:MAG: hypothetical protein A2X29_06095 [Elusimicrobia bacterium GWA2_64_40]OGR64122.1 MAG: hypothetical protein A2X30_12445 [Elusimicrobia bacterium GWB2_63_16]HAN05809.1 hypothetical protein [Elusimicrobiota bacterium]HAU89165.1 hypothetical protein [Elusimicrobiota bacterium]